MQRRSLVIYFTAVVVSAFPVHASGQADATKPPPNPDVVTVDLRGRALGGTLPFDQKLGLRGPLDTLTEVVAVRYERVTAEGQDEIIGDPWCGYWIRQKPVGATPRARQTQFALEIPQLRLEPNKDYLFEFRVYEAPDAALQPPPSDTTCMTAPMGTHIPGATLTDSLVIHGDTHIEFSQRFDTDLGMAWAPGAEYIGATSGVHFFFMRPINKKLDLAELGFWKSIPHRLSLYGGLAVNELGSGNDVKSALSVGSPMLGVGIRGPLYWSKDTPFAWALRPIRLNTGIIWFEQDDPNPLVDETALKRDWFWSVTADIDLKTILGPFVALLTPK